VRFSNYRSTLLVGAVALACATKPTPITVTGEAQDKASLAGKWVGEYQSAATGRSGSIVFNLSPSGDAAKGDVVMIPRGYGKALAPYGNSGTANAGAVTTPTTGASTEGVQGSEVLTIRVVRVSGDSISGVLDPYRDPECDCPVATTFTGRLDGDTIEGAFSTSGRQSNAPQTGTWRVKRTR